jgi:WD40 repeat protein
LKRTSSSGVHTLNNFASSKSSYIYLRSGRELGTLFGHTDGVTGVALSGDERLAVSGSWNKTLKVWDVSSGRELRSLTGHTQVVPGAALSADGRLAVSSSWDQTLKVWEVASGAMIGIFICEGAAYCIAFSDSLHVIIAGDVGNVSGHIHFLRAKMCVFLYFLFCISFLTRNNTRYMVGSLLASRSLILSEGVKHGRSSSPSHS